MTLINGYSGHAGRGRNGESCSAFSDALSSLRLMVLAGATIYDVAQKAAELVAGTLHADYVHVAEVVSPGESLRLLVHHGWNPDSALPATLPSGFDFPEGYAITSGQTTTSENLETDARFEIPQWLLGNGLTSVACTPIEHNGVQYGVIGAYSTTRSMVGSQMKSLEGIAAALGDVMERVRADELLRRESHEQTVLAEIGKVISSSLRLEEIYGLFAEQVKTLVPFDRIAISTIDHDESTFQISYVAGDDWLEYRPGKVIPLQGTNKEYVVRTGQGLLVGEHNLKSLASQVPTVRETVEAGLLSSMTVPLKWHDEVIAVLTLRSRKPNAYGERDLKFVNRIAAGIAGALANARMYEAVQRDADERSIIAELGRTIGSSLHIDDVYETFAAQFRRLVPFDRISISTIHPRTGVIERTYVHGADVPGWTLGRMQPAGPLTDLVIRRGTGIMRVAGQTYADHGPQPYQDDGSRHGLLSALAVPLMVRGHPVGAMCLRAFAPHAYTNRHLLLAERVAAQIAGAIGNVQLHAELQKEIDDRSVLETLGYLVAGSDDVESLVDHTHQNLRRLLRFDRMIIGLLDKRLGGQVSVYSRGKLISDETLDAVGRLDVDSVEGTYKELFDEYRGPIEGKYGLSAGDAALLKNAGLTAWLQVPLLSGGNLLGYLALQGRPRRAYRSEHSRVLERVSAQIAPAVEKLFYKQALHRADFEREFACKLRHMSRSHDRVNGFMDEAVPLVKKLTPFDRMVIVTVSQTDSLIRVIYDTDSGAPDEYAESHIDLNGTTTEAIIDSMRGRLLLREGRGHAAHPDSVLPEIGGSLDFASGVAAPIADGLNTFGVVYLLSLEKHRYLETDAQTLEVVGSHLAPYLFHLCHWERSVLSGNSGPPSIGRFSEVEVPLTPFSSVPYRSSATPANAMAIIVIDSHMLCRHALKAVFEESHIHVIAEAEPRTAMAVVKSHRAAAVVYDVHADDSIDFSLVMKLKSEFPALKIMLLAEQADNDQLLAALRSGASGFMLKGMSPSTLVNAIEQIVQGGTVVDTELLDDVVQSLRSPDAESLSHYQDIINSLTDRDREILSNVAMGKTTAEIAGALNLAVGTVRNRLVEIYRVLDVSDRAGAVYMATRLGLVR